MSLSPRCRPAEVCAINSTASVADSEQCNGYVGNSDLYSLGNRLGIYCQWTSTLLAHRSGLGVENESSILLEADSIFLLAVFCAVVKLTLERTARYVDIVILLKICFGFILAALQYDHWTGSCTGTILRIMLAVATASYSVWLRSTAHGGNIAYPECPSFTFFFTELDVHGPIHYVELVSSIILTAFFCYRGLRVWIRFRRRQNLRSLKGSALYPWVQWVDANTVERAPSWSSSDETKSTPSSAESEISQEIPLRKHLVEGALLGLFVYVTAIQLKPTKLTTMTRKRGLASSDLEFYVGYVGCPRNRANAFVELVT